MKAQERHQIKQNLKYNKFRGKQEAREYLKGLAQRKNANLPTDIRDLIKQVLKETKC